MYQLGGDVLTQKKANDIQIEVLQKELQLHKDKINEVLQTYEKKYRTRIDSDSEDGKDNDHHTRDINKILETLEDVKDGRIILREVEQRKMEELNSSKFTIDLSPDQEFDLLL